MRFLLLALLCGTAQAATFVSPSVTGQAPSGIYWKTVASGTVMPTTSGRPGAVAYITDGVLQIDPKGLNISSFTFSGPSFISNSAFIVAPLLGQPIMPSGTWASAGILQSNLSGWLTGPNLNTRAPSGKGASSNGWLNRPWNFGPVFSKAPSANSFKARSPTANNVLGFGPGTAMFTYTVHGILGTQLGPVIPSRKMTNVAVPQMVAVPEPSYLVVGLAALFLKKSRRAR